MVPPWCSSAVSGSELLILVWLGPVGSAGACLYHVCNVCPYATVLPLQKYGSLPSLDILRIISGLGKLHLIPGNFRHVAIFKLQIFMPPCAITSAAFKGSSERSTEKRTAFSLHLQQYYSSYTGQMLKRSQSMSQPCPGLFHSNL